MKQVLFTLLTVFTALVPLSMEAYDIEVDGIYYIIYGNEAIVTFKGQTAYWQVHSVFSAAY